jgi:2-polyprenyl-3-methyl-5-hydroxy-6-metoxy-1,4-benzoquinol methylase
MNAQSRANQRAWNHRAYEFWNRSNGTPSVLAAKLLQNPDTNLSVRYRGLLGSLKGKRILNALGSNGRKAVPLCLMGAEVTIVDISEENRRYALELAECAGVSLKYVMADLATYKDDSFDGYFDIVFSEGGVLHYFSDLDGLFQKLSSYLKVNGRLILNDFHPYRKMLFPEIGTNGNYFDNGLHDGPIAYEDQFNESERSDFPKCLLRYYTIGEVVTAIGSSGLWIKEMREIPKDGMESVPGEFTIAAQKLA